MSAGWCLLFVDDDDMNAGREYRLRLWRREDVDEETWRGRAADEAATAAEAWLSWLSTTAWVMLGGGGWEMEYDDFWTAAGAAEEEEEV